MKISKIGYTALLILIYLNVNAQKAILNKADKEYNQYAFIDAISIYEKAVEKGHKDEKILQRLGNAYYFNADLKKALKWYQELFTLNIEQEPEYYYRYAQTLKSTGNYDKSDEMMQLFNMRVESDIRGEIFANNKDYLEQIKDNSGRFEISDSGINSNQSDYGSTFSHNKLVFASTRDTGIVTKKIFKWTNKNFTNLYTAAINADGTLGSPKRFDKAINSKFNESTPVFTKDGKTMYFTRNNFSHHKRGKDNKKITLLKLYRAQFIKNKWTNISELSFNSNEYSTAHPALSPDEKKLYFASDMPGGYGKSDLYSVTINDDGTFGKPENLGSTINTEERETFPFVSEDNELYFASDGRVGLGGLDIYAAKIKSDGSFETVQNIGEPVNTSYDDFAFIIDHITRKGFFSSNKQGGTGDDDIYQFLETRRLDCQKTLSGIIADNETNLGLDGVEVILFDKHFQEVERVISAIDGTYSFQIKCNKIYHVRAAKKDYETTESTIPLEPFNDKSELNIKLEKQIKPIAIGIDLAKTLKIPTIYFELDKAVLQKEASFELEKVLAVLNQYQKMKIDVRSHTDSRQTKEYNMILSDKRAKVTIDWFIKRGISKDRLTGKGYGESQPVNKCSDGINCTEKEHQLNRRSEFIILFF